MRQALGLIEAIGLATAIEATDAAVKSANVELLGLESAKGDGMHTIKVVGDVGAVKAAVEAATAACAKGRGVFSTKVIARPADGLGPMIYNNQTRGFDPEQDRDRMELDSYWVFNKYDQKKPTTAVEKTLTPISEEKDEAVEEQPTEEE